MSTKGLRILCCLLCLAVVGPAATMAAQEGGDHDRERRGSSGGPGGPGGNLGEGPGGPREPRHNEKERERSRTGTQQPRNALQFGPVGRWWDDRSVVQAIGLRKEQQRRMDAIFDRSKPAILDSYKGFLKAQSALAAANKDPQTSKDRLFAAIDAVNEARAALQKATSAMLLQIRKEMDPGQVDKLEKIQ